MATFEQIVDMAIEKIATSTSLYWKKYQEAWEKYLEINRDPRNTKEHLKSLFIRLYSDQQTTLQLIRDAPDEVVTTFIAKIDEYIKVMSATPSQDVQRTQTAQDKAFYDKLFTNIFALAIAENFKISAQRSPKESEPPSPTPGIHQDSKRGSAPELTVVQRDETTTPLAENVAGVTTHNIMRTKKTKKTRILHDIEVKGSAVALPQHIPLQHQPLPKTHTATTPIESKRNAPEGTREIKEFKRPSLTPTSPEISKQYEEHRQKALAALKIYREQLDLMQIPPSSSSGRIEARIRAQEIAAERRGRAKKAADTAKNAAVLHFNQSGPDPTGFSFEDVAPLWGKDGTQINNIKGLANILAQQYTLVAENADPRFTATLEEKARGQQILLNNLIRTNTKLGFQLQQHLLNLLKQKGPPYIQAFWQVHGARDIYIALQRAEATQSPKSFRAFVRTVYMSWDTDNLMRVIQSLEDTAAQQLERRAIIQVLLHRKLTPAQWGIIISHPENRTALFARDRYVDSMQTLGRKLVLPAFNRALITYKATDTTEENASFRKLLYTRLLAGIEGGGPEAVTLLNESLRFITLTAEDPQFLRGLNAQVAGLFPWDYNSLTRIVGYAVNQWVSHPDDLWKFIRNRWHELAVDIQRDPQALRRLFMRIIRGWDTNPEMQNARQVGAIQLLSLMTPDQLVLMAITPPENPLLLRILTTFSSTPIPFFQNKTVFNYVMEIARHNDSLYGYVAATAYAAQGNIWQELIISEIEISHAYRILHTHPALLAKQALANIMLILVRKDPNRVRLLTAEQILNVLQNIERPGDQQEFIKIVLQSSHEHIQQNAVIALLKRMTSHGNSFVQFVESLKNTAFANLIIESIRAESELRLRYVPEKISELSDKAKSLLRDLLQDPIWVSQRNINELTAALAAVGESGVWQALAQYRRTETQLHKLSGTSNEVRIQNEERLITIERIRYRCQHNILALMLTDSVTFVPTNINATETLNIAQLDSELREDGITSLTREFTHALAYIQQQPEIGFPVRNTITAQIAVMANELFSRQPPLTIGTQLKQLGFLNALFNHYQNHPNTAAEFLNLLMPNQRVKLLQLYESHTRNAPKTLQPIFSRYLLLEEKDWNHNPERLAQLIDTADTEIKGIIESVLTAPDDVNLEHTRQQARTLLANPRTMRYLGEAGYSKYQKLLHIATTSNAPNQPRNPELATVLAQIYNGLLANSEHPEHVKDALTYLSKFLEDSLAISYNRKSFLERGSAWLELQRGKREQNLIRILFEQAQKRINENTTPQADDLFTPELTVLIIRTKTPINTPEIKLLLLQHVAYHVSHDPESRAIQIREGLLAKYYQQDLFLTNELLNLIRLYKSRGRIVLAADLLKALLQDPIRANELAILPNSELTSLCQDLIGLRDDIFSTNIQLLRFAMSAHMVEVSNDVNQVMNYFDRIFTTLEIPENLSEEGAKSIAAELANIKSAYWKYLLKDAKGIALIEKYKAVIPSFQMLAAGQKLEVLLKEIQTKNLDVTNVKKLIEFYINHQIWTPTQLAQTIVNTNLYGNVAIVLLQNPIALRSLEQAEPILLAKLKKFAYMQVDRKGVINDFNNAAIQNKKFRDDIAQNWQTYAGKPNGSNLWELTSPEILIFTERFMGKPELFGNDKLTNFNLMAQNAAANGMSTEEFLVHYDETDHRQRQRIAQQLPNFWMNYNVTESEKIESDMSAIYKGVQHYKDTANHQYSPLLQCYARCYATDHAIANKIVIRNAIVKNMLDDPTLMHVALTAGGDNQQARIIFVGELTRLDPQRFTNAFTLTNQELTLTTRRAILNSQGYHELKIYCGPPKLRIYHRLTLGGDNYARLKNRSPDEVEKAQALATFETRVQNAERNKKFAWRFFFAMGNLLEKAFTRSPKKTSGGLESVSLKKLPKETRGRAWTMGEDAASLKQLTPKKRESYKATSARLRFAIPGSMVITTREPKPNMPLPVTPRNLTERRRRTTPVQPIRAATSPAQSVRDEANAITRRAVLNIITDVTPQSKIPSVGTSLRDSVTVPAKRKSTTPLAPKTESADTESKQTLPPKKPLRVLGQEPELYRDSDMEAYIKYEVRTDPTLGDYAPGCEYRLNNVIHDEGDGLNYHVAVTPPLDTKEKALVIDYFLDKTKQQRSEVGSIIAELLKNQDFVNILSVPDAQGAQDFLISCIQQQVTQRHGSPELVRAVMNHIIESGYDRNQLRQRLTNLSHGAQSPDVFDEFATQFRSETNAHFKILYPYNRTQSHWLLGEIKIHKQGHQYNIELFAHDPFGSGRLEQNNYTLLSQTIKKRIIALDPQATITQVKNSGSPYDEPRQHSRDYSSCGPCTSDATILRIQGKSLNQPQPYPRHAIALRHDQFFKIQQYYANSPIALESFTNRNWLPEFDQPQFQEIKTISPPTPRTPTSNEIKREHAAKQIMKLPEQIIALLVRDIETIQSVRRLTKQHHPMELGLDDEVVLAAEKHMPDIFWKFITAVTGAKRGDLSQEISRREKLSRQEDAWLAEYKSEFTNKRADLFTDFSVALTLFKSTLQAYEESFKEAGDNPRLAEEFLAVVEKGFNILQEKYQALEQGPLFQRLIRSLGGGTDIKAEEIFQHIRCKGAPAEIRTQIDHIRTALSEDKVSKTKILRVPPVPF